jgi:hypothetical protein
MVERRENGEDIKLTVRAARDCSMDGISGGANMERIDISGVSEICVADGMVIAFGDSVIFANIDFSEEYRELYHSIGDIEHKNEEYDDHVNEHGERC